MVWGMNLPSGFGEFWPDGDFETDTKTRDDGWSDRLNNYYDAQTPEERARLYAGDTSTERTVSYAYYVCQKFICETGKKGDGDPTPLSPIEPHEAPQFFKTEKTYTSLGSLIKLNNRIIAVDDALKAVIERFEQGVHQFFPIEIRMPKGAIYPSGYHTLAIGQYFGSFSPEKSKAGSYRGPSPIDPNYYSHEETKAGVTGLALSKVVFGKAHLWRERSLREWLTCFSDELKAEIDIAGLHLPKIYKMKEV